jgi:hypothetical protein
MVYYTFQNVRNKNDCKIQQGEWTNVEKDVYFCKDPVYNNITSVPEDISYVNQTEQDDFNHSKDSFMVALMVSLISTTTPIMFMLSCTIVIKFS